MLDNYQLLYSWNFFPTSRSVLGYFEVVIWHLTMKLFPERPVIECLFLYSFASDPPSTARVNLRPLYRLCRHQFSRPKTILRHLTSVGGRDHSNHSRTSIIQSWRPEKRANLTQNSDGFFAHALQAELWSIKHERGKTLKMGASLLKLPLTLNGVVWGHKQGNSLQNNPNEDAQWLTRAHPTLNRRTFIKMVSKIIHKRHFKLPFWFWGLIWLYYVHVYGCTYVIMIERCGNSSQKKNMLGYVLCSVSV